MSAPVCLSQRFQGQRSEYNHRSICHFPLLSSDISIVICGIMIVYKTALWNKVSSNEGTIIAGIIGGNMSIKNTLRLLAGSFAEEKNLNWFQVSFRPVLFIFFLFLYQGITNIPCYVSFRCMI